ncbi:hypothetical protein PENTCL1PPCAC_1679, partial [Pristionchus entomophagus]
QTDEPIHRRPHRLSITDEEGLEIGGGRVRAMVEAVERRTQRDNAEKERSQRMSELIESMKEVVLSQINLPQRMLRYHPSHSIDILTLRTREWLSEHGKVDVEQALDSARCALQKRETKINYLHMPIAQELYYIIENIIHQMVENEKMAKLEKVRDEMKDNEEIEDDMEVLSLQGNIDSDVDEDEEGEEEDSLLSSFEVVEDMVECTHKCDPSHVHHHSRIEMLTTLPGCASVVDHLAILDSPLSPPPPSLPLTELTLSGVPFNLDWKTHSYWMEVTEQWASERTRMNREETGSV